MTRYQRLIMLLILATLTSGAQGALRCGASLVSDGAWPIEVEERCGPPDYVAEYPSATVPGLGVVQTEMHWYYNPGPQRFIRLLVFRNGRLARVESLGYGFHTDGMGTCGPNTLRHIQNEYELVTRCGQPASKRVEWQLPTPRRRSETWQVLQPVLIQQWLYDFSSNQFRQVVTLRNGRVINIESRPGN
ncbi:DUF2845 domain-containing protein [Marinobacter sp. M216]|uniref:DUF2845 domain-containing protein n=1 Tax=Marinobacter albus TaxID=3030833 RepID=A0ABT7HDT9_9GAMM|nr:MULTISPECIES: DUF2845 domain-containing protein [unclassified Marinobacter]MBW7469509.1 DUF2845 domain-containing protein [Marinobacter sp. F4218]MDK9558222.1 DUF2845 domain-containing protein [Marinobacter sp. M216]